MRLPDRIVADITIDDIVYGCRKEPDRCPIARMLLRVTGAGIASVTSLEAHMLRGLEFAAYTHDARAWVIAYDNGQEVQPRTVTFTRKAA